MIRIIDHPSIVFVVSLLAQWGAAYTGDVFRRWRPIGKNEREDFNTVLTATLTLLALIIGFSFSMAVSRYDQRKNNEEAEANAIGTEYARADLLPTDDGTKLRELLRRYVNQRILSLRLARPPAMRTNCKILEHCNTADELAAMREEIARKINQAYL